MAILGASQNLAPNFVMKVGSQMLEIGVTDLITDVSYEFADGMADVCKIKIMNPDYKVSDARVFQPGNEVALWMGYGTSLSFIGRTVIDRPRANFPPGGAMPFIDVIGYTKDVAMKDNAPPEVTAKKGKKKRGKGGRTFKDSLFSDAVEARLANYSFKTQVDKTHGSPRNIMQKAGMNDFEFVTGMANITGFLFWVEGDEDGNWTGYFLDPEGQSLSTLQDKKYTFEYGTKMATLQSFVPEQVFSGSITKLTYEVHNPKNGKVEKSEIEITEGLFDTQVADDPTAVIEGDPTDGGEIKLYIGDFSIEVASGKTFRDISQFEEWAEAWYRRNRENFVLARGLVIGTETLKARQTHEIAGVGEAYNGDYYFTRVKHMMSSNGGFITDFNCRKVIG